jgi:hypothetical protein
VAFFVTFVAFVVFVIDRRGQSRDVMNWWSAIAAAVATFNESAPGAIGIRARRAAERSAASVNPVPS